MLNGLRRWCGCSAGPSQQGCSQDGRQVRDLPHVRCRRCAATIAMHSNGSAVHWRAAGPRCTARCTDARSSAFKVWKYRRSSPGSLAMFAAMRRGGAVARATDERPPSEVACDHPICICLDLRGRRTVSASLSHSAAIVGWNAIPDPLAQPPCSGSNRHNARSP